MENILAPKDNLCGPIKLAGTIGIMIVTGSISKATMDGGAAGTSRMAGLLPFCLYGGFEEWTEGVGSGVGIVGVG